MSQNNPYADGQWGVQPQQFADPTGTPSLSEHQINAYLYQPQPNGLQQTGSSVYRPAGAPAAGWSPYNAMLPDHPQATTVLVLGIASLFVGVLSFVGWYMGRNALSEIRQGAPYKDGGSLKTGYILSVVISIIQLVTLAFVALWFILAIVLGLGALSFA